MKCLCLILGVMMVTSARAADRRLGAVAGQLAPCPESPNCVSSQTDQAANRVEPLRYEGDRQSAKAKLLKVIAEFPRTRIEADDDRYVHAVFTTWLMRFKDDVEFYFSESEPVIHVRSASRVGYSDLGANRRRVEDLRKAFAGE